MLRRSPKGADAPSGRHLASQLLERTVGDQLLAKRRRPFLNRAGTGVAQALREPHVIGIGRVGDQLLSRQRDRLLILKLHHLVKGGEAHDQIRVLHDRSIEEQLQRRRVVAQGGDRVAA